ncbi:hypothetical protein RND71_007082 [Anisodus tanguticus]|uniref:Uncharacterized protein n=1 Tax=Anisodus tanguticus TaxID=243964 RepID=A0AAE1SIF0_9SOLA|nr:hypothetical protein RND71_007082 [Anisodus tanguticus]
MKRRWEKRIAREKCWNNIFLEKCIVGFNFCGFLKTLILNKSWDFSAFLKKIWGQ